MAGSLKTASRKKVRIKGNIGIVVARWNEEITEALLLGAIQALENAGIARRAIKVRHVPGSFELPLAAQQFANQRSVSGVICLGCLIKGDTPHFEYISEAVAHGLMQVGLKFSKPVLFGVLTTLTHQQALDRAGGKLGNKGEEAAASLLEMLSA